MNESLVNFRNSSKLTQKEMAQKLGVTLSFYSKVELGIRNPSFNFLVKFKSIFPDSCVDDIFLNVNYTDSVKVVCPKR